MRYLSRPTGCPCWNDPRSFWMNMNYPSKDWHVPWKLMVGRWNFLLKMAIFREVYLQPLACLKPSRWKPWPSQMLCKLSHFGNALICLCRVRYHTALIREPLTFWLGAWKHCTDYAYSWTQCGIKYWSDWFVDFLWSNNLSLVLLVSLWAEATHADSFLWHSDYLTHPGRHGQDGWGWKCGSSTGQKSSMKRLSVPPIVSEQERCGIIVFSSEIICYLSTCKISITKPLKTWTSLAWWAQDVARLHTHCRFIASWPLQTGEDRIRTLHIGAPAENGIDPCVVYVRTFPYGSNLFERIFIFQNNLKILKGSHQLWQPLVAHQIHIDDKDLGPRIVGIPWSISNAWQVRIQSLIFWAGWGPFLRQTIANMNWLRFILSSKGRMNR